MKISQTYRPVLVATHTINSAPPEPKSALRGLMQRLGLALLASTLVIGATGSANAGEAQDEAADRGLGSEARFLLHTRQNALEFQPVLTVARRLPKVKVS